MKSPKGWYALDEKIGQTPCLCGAIDTWHQSCYSGKTAEQIEAAYESAYKKARALLADRVKTEAQEVLNKAAKP
jgi:hypothetical protein